MAIEIGKILRSFIGKNLDSTIETQLFQTELAEEDDGQTIEELHIPGFQYRPTANSRPFVARVTDAWKICLGIDDFITKESLLEGERLFYADLNGIITARIHLKSDGKIIIGNGTEELIDLIDQLLTELQKTVDLGGAASTGTLFKINPALAIIQTKLSTIKG